MQSQAAALQPDDVAMNQTYLAAVPAIGFVQVWFSPAQAPFAEKPSSVAPFIARQRLRTLPRSSCGNHTKADWQFTTKNARIKLKHLYPAI